jgi:thymidine phosphorylase
MAGAPNDQMAGIYLNKVKGDKVVKGETILTIYANNKEKLKFAIERLNGFEGIIIK